MYKIEAKNIVIGMTLDESRKIKDVVVFENGNPGDAQDLLGYPSVDQMRVIILDEKSTKNWHAIATTIMNMQLHGEGDDRAIRNCIEICIKSVVDAIQKDQ